MAAATFADAFVQVRSSWFRLETLQAYDVEGEYAPREEFARTGQLARPADPDWVALVAGHAGAGRRLQRVHVIEDPLTDYLAFEVAAYEHNHAAGEDVRLIVVPAGQWPHGLPRETDFWLFDAETDTESAWKMVYDESGGFVNAEQVTDPERIEVYRRWRDIALATATPLADYLSRSA